MCRRSLMHLFNHQLFSQFVDIIASTSRESENLLLIPEAQSMIIETHQTPRHQTLAQLLTFPPSAHPARSSASPSSYPSH